MASPLLFLCRMAVSRRHLSLVPCPAPTAAEIHIVDGGPLVYRALCPYPSPSLDPVLDLCHGLVGLGRRADVCGMRDLAHPASYLSLGKGDAYS